MPRRSASVAAPAPAAVPDKHEKPKKPKQPKQVRDAAENERRAAQHDAALKVWEQQMEQHAALMASRKKAQKAASRPADDSERRVRQRRESQVQADADASNADQRRAAKKRDAQRNRVRQLEQVGLIDAVRDCVAHFSDDRRYAEARRAFYYCIIRNEGSVKKRNEICTSPGAVRALT